MHGAKGGKKEVRTVLPDFFVVVEPEHLDGGRAYRGKYGDKGYRDGPGGRRGNGNEGYGFRVKRFGVKCGVVVRKVGMGGKGKSYVYVSVCACECVCDGGGGWGGEGMTDLLFKIS